MSFERKGPIGWDSSTKVYKGDRQKLAPAHGLINSRVIPVNCSPDPSRSNRPEEDYTRVVKMTKIMSSHLRRPLFAPKYEYNPVKHYIDLTIDSDGIDDKNTNLKVSTENVQLSTKKSVQSPTKHKKLFERVSQKHLHRFTRTKSVKPLKVETKDGIDPNSKSLHPVVQRLSKFLLTIEDPKVKQVIVARAQFLSVHKKWADSELCELLILGSLNLKPELSNQDKIDDLTRVVDSSKYKIVEVGRSKQLIVVKDTSCAEKGKNCLKPLKLPSKFLEDKVVKLLCTYLGVYNSFDLLEKLSESNFKYDTWIRVKKDPNDHNF